MLVGSLGKRVRVCVRASALACLLAPSFHARRLAPLPLLPPPQPNVNTTLSPPRKGMLPSASLGDPSGPGVFEPCHGSAPDIAGQVSSLVRQPATLFLSF